MGYGVSGDGNFGGLGNEKPAFPYHSIYATDFALAFQDIVLFGYSIVCAGNVK